MESFEHESCRQAGGARALHDAYRPFASSPRVACNSFRFASSTLGNSKSNDHSPSIIAAATTIRAARFSAKAEVAAMVWTPGKNRASRTVAARLLVEQTRGRLIYGAGECGKALIFGANKCDKSALSVRTGTRKIAWFVPNAGPVAVRRTQFAVDSCLLAAPQFWPPDGWRPGA